MINRWKYTAFYAVVCRELERIVSRRLYLGVCIILPLFSLFFMSTIFGNGQMENIPIGIVDQDQSALSRQIVREVAAVPTFRVQRYFVNPADARKAMQGREIYGYLLVPDNFEIDALTGHEAVLSYYYHYALLSVGAEVRGAFETVLRTLSLSPVIMQASALGIGERQISSFLLPIRKSSHLLFNPDLDYSVYLSQPYFYVMLQVIVLLTTVYVLGSEIKFHTAEGWLAVAGNDMLTAVAGKLFPYTVIFSLMSILANWVMFGCMHIPFSCSFTPLILSAILLVLASQALALFIFSLFPAISIIISIVSMIGSLGATLCGVTFPVTSMYTPVYYASYLFPIRHFIEISHTLLYGNYGLAYSWQNYCVLLAFLLPPLLLLPRLKTAILCHKYEDIE